MNYDQRVKQRTIYYHTGIISISVGGGVFLLIIVLALANIYFQKMTQLGLIAMTLIGFGVIMVVFFSGLGWNKSRIIDFCLNQLSLIGTVVGFLCAGVGFVNEMAPKLILSGFLCIIVGIILANLGVKFSSSPP